MADTTTTNLSLTKPELDVSTNWGQKLNANLDAIDAIFSGTGTGVSLNIDGGDIASAVTINKSPVITLGGDLTGNVTLTNLASGTLTATIAATSVENSMLAGSIANSKLSNSSITVGAGVNSTAISLGGTINFSGTSNEVEVTESSGTITIGLPSATEITTSLGVAGGSTNGVLISNGSIALKNDGTQQSNIDFYCESSNAHYARLQAPAHSAFSGNVTVTLPATTGTLALTSGDITGNAATATALATARTIHGVSFDGTANIDLTEVIQDTVGAMVSGNTESNITVTYEDSDGTLDFSVTGGGSVSEAFKTISVSGQSDVVADAAADTLTLVAGSNMTITTNASGDEITFASSGGGGSQNLFSTIAVSGQSNVVADSTTDTLTLVAGSNITLTTDASSDSITIASSASGSGGSSSAFAKNTFAGDGSTTDFTLSTSMTNEDGLIVFIDGVYQADNVYSVSSSTLSFATAPVNGRVIEVFQLEGGIVGTTPSIDTMTGDGSDTTLTLSTTPSSENQTFVTFDGVVQHKSTYSLSSNVITFSTAPATGVAVECITFNNVAIATFEDADGDTKIQVEESSDEDKIRFDIAGTEEMVMDASGIVINDGSNDRDFRIESNGSTHMLFVDGGNDRVGINEDAPQQNLSVGVTAGSLSGISLTLNDTDLAAFLTSSSTGEVRIGGVYTNYFPTFYSNNSEVMRIDTSGNVGINTSSPDAPLHVFGENANGTDLATSASNAKVRFRNHSGSSLTSNEGYTGNSWYKQISNGGGTTAYDLSLNPFGGKVSVGTDDPSALLQVHGGSVDYDPSSTGTGLFHVTAGASSNYSGYIGISDSGMSIGHNGGGSRYLRFDTNETERLRIDSAGHVTKPFQTSVHVKRSSQQNNIPINTNQTVLFDGEIFDVNSDFNTSTSVFVAPVTGKYLFTTSVRIESVPTDFTYIYLYLVTSNGNRWGDLMGNGTQYFNSAPLYVTMRFSVITDMDVNDSAYLRIYQAGGTSQADINANSNFCIQLLS